MGNLFLFYIMFYHQGRSYWCIKIFRLFVAFFVKYLCLLVFGAVCRDLHDRRLTSNRRKIGKIFSSFVFWWLFVVFLPICLIFWVYMLLYLYFFWNHIILLQKFHRSLLVLLILVAQDIRSKLWVCLQFELVLKI